MANQKYAQVADLNAAGTLVWGLSPIVGVLLQGATFVGSHKRVSDLTANVINTYQIGGCVLGEGGQAMGQPAVFQAARAGAVYQMALCQNDSSGDHLLLALIDSNAQGAPITIERDGTLIIRPVLVGTPPPGNPSDVTGVWLQL
jgi:hypothetical protein